MQIGMATVEDFRCFLDLAAEVEEWFGPMGNEPNFYDAVRKNIARESALVAIDAGQAVGGMLFSRQRAPS